MAELKQSADKTHDEEMCACKKCIEKLMAVHQKHLEAWLKRDNKVDLTMILMTATLSERSKGKILQ